jgi:hypothetical protein
MHSQPTPLSVRYNENVLLSRRYSRRRKMDFIDQINELSDKISKRSERLETEEATKNARVMPFIRALGYDVFNPEEVVPEFTCDVGTKKGEKVDYAITV